MMVFYKQRYLEVYKAFLIFLVKLRIVVSEYLMLGIPGLSLDFLDSGLLH